MKEKRFAQQYSKGLLWDLYCHTWLIYCSCVFICHQMGPGSVDQMYYQGRHCGENWGDERKPIFIQQGKKIHAFQEFN